MASLTVNTAGTTSGRSVITVKMPATPRGLPVVASSKNTGNVYFGPSAAVTAAPSDPVNDGFELGKGAGFQFDQEKLQAYARSQGRTDGACSIYFVADQDGQTVTYDPVG